MKTKILLIFLTVFIKSTLVAQFNHACAPNGIILYKQQEIDSFPANYPNCSIILGNLQIIDNNTVTNLDSLIYITEVLGNLTIGAPDYIMYNLNNIEGLSNLSHIGGDLKIWNTIALNDLSGLENLENIDGFLDIHGNENLSNIDALNNLEFVYTILVGGNIDNVDFIESMNYIKGTLSLGGIQNMHGLQNLDSIGKSLILHACPQSDLLFLSNLKKVGSFMTISYMNSITDLEGLNNLESIGGYLSVWHNDSLTSIEGLNSLKKIEGNFRVEKNSSIQSINIPNLEIIKGAIKIEYNDSLTNVSGFDSLTIIGNGLRINYNPNLQIFNALSSVSILKGYVSITNNPRLQNLPPMPNIENDSISTLIIYNNDSIPDLEGLNNITTVKHDLILSTNANLNNISALSNLTDFKGKIVISKNPLLTTLSGLDSINSDSINNLIINDNEKLSFCAVESICNYLADTNAIVSIENNAPGCNSFEEVEQACLVFVDETRPNNQLIFYPNPSHNKLYFTGSETKKITQLTIYNQLGQLVLQARGPNNIVDISGLKRGLFIVEVEIDGVRFREKIIKK